MNISSISNFSYKSLGFKGDKTSNPIENNKESQQNNGYEVKIAPATYMAMQVSSAFDRLEEQGVIFENDEGNIDVAPEFDVTDEESDLVDMSADMAISGLRTTASMMSNIDVDKRFIPTFVILEYKNFIATFEKGIQEAKKLVERMELPDIDELPDFDEMLDLDEEITPEFVAKRSLAMLPDMIEMQEIMLEKFKTTKVEELKEALEELSLATNAMLFNAIRHGFERNARAVVADLSGDFELYNDPEVTDNYDGTLTYVYTTLFGGKYEIVKDKETGDYIRAAQYDVTGQNTGFNIEFNKDGSIKNLNYINNVDKSVVNISQEGNRVVAKQIFNDLVTERQFVKNEDNTLKLTFVNIYTS